MFYYSPEDQLIEEESRLARARASVSSPAVSQDENFRIASEPKRQRLAYEGESDTSKWAVQPAPDIFATSILSTYAPEKRDTTRHGGAESEHPSHSSAEHKQPELVSYTDGQTETDMPELQLSNEVVQQIISLCTAQNDFERRLYEHRKRIQHEQERALRQLEAREIIAPVPKREREGILRQHAADLERADKRAIEKLDDLRYQQQLRLQNLNVPGIYPSSDVNAMQAQQAILKRLLGKR
ncbi:hypothetical protein GGI25_002197 [Coemansia spiralis]|uniref:Uncharacterized protein n=2 Tax=Coemansia TaxID=4863 RepID=A0A9W8KYQ9_9FUNG|nr:hypothetical protein BX070DRAFT_106505 [Coemansia spiralis]KAJ1996206.1 hypothetical protein EDC05_000096 [Coemansia umbellata]KAJ2626037.1 hypothetical protein GGI26_000121 [Coemansia sp. RSA 1358]KAJ2678609.1 hypothetical protein GGI25_002197 [Coemansia spiralis]